MSDRVDGILNVTIDTLDSGSFNVSTLCDGLV